MPVFFVNVGIHAIAKAENPNMVMIKMYGSMLVCRNAKPQNSVII